jgi:sensor histidine kinase YesM
LTNGQTTIDQYGKNMASSVLVIVIWSLVILILFGYCNLVIGYSLNIEEFYMIILIIVGMPTSGKNIARTFAELNDIPYFATGDIVREEVKKQGLGRMRKIE